MSLLVFVQIIINLVLFLGLAVMWSRLRRPPKEDPRLSRGLQLLQSKIAVLEDLSDRTDVQVRQLTQLLDNKARHIQTKIFEADKAIDKVENTMTKSMEVAEIFQDKIPHQEIIERQNTIRYVQAARLAHQGKNVDEIAQAVSLPREQIEFIAKVNRDQLMFNEEALPEWAKAEVNDAPGTPSTTELEFVDFETTEKDYASLSRLNKEFKQACEQFEREQNQPLPPIPGQETATQMVSMAKSVTGKIIDSASDFLQEAKPLETAAAALNTVQSKIRARNIEIRPVQFPKIEKIDTNTKL